MASSEKTSRESFSLKTDDIAGAKPFLKSYQYTNKPDFTNSTAGIDKSTPHAKNLQTNRQINPLVPEYKLPTSQNRPYTPPRFIRNSMDMSDIAGTTPSTIQRNLLRNTLDVSDISNVRSLDARKMRKSLGFVGEIEVEAAKTCKFQTRRDTNPLDPVYDIADKDNHVVKYGEIAGSSPRVLINTKTLPHTRSYDVKDIQGIACTKSFVASKESICKKVNGHPSTKMIGDTSKNATIGPGSSFGFHSPGGKIDNSYVKSPSNSIQGLDSLGNDFLKGSFELEKHIKKQVKNNSRIKKIALPISSILSPKTKK